jgi:hypothetical protein
MQSLAGLNSSLLETLVPRGRGDKRRSFAGLHLQWHFDGCGIYWKNPHVTIWISRKEKGEGNET